MRSPWPRRAARHRDSARGVGRRLTTLGARTVEINQRVGCGLFADEGPRGGADDTGRRIHGDERFGAVEEAENSEEYLVNEGRDLDVVVFSTRRTPWRPEAHGRSRNTLRATSSSWRATRRAGSARSAMRWRRRICGGRCRPLRESGLFANSGQYVGSRTAVLRFVDWAVGQLDAKEVTPELLATLLSPSQDRGDEGPGAEPSDQCLLHAYWASYPDRVRIDSNAAVFASFAASTCSRPTIEARTPRDARPTGSRPRRSGGSRSRRRLPKGSPFSNKPRRRPAPSWNPVKRFSIDGPGYYCDDHDHVAGRLTSVWKIIAWTFVSLHAIEPTRSRGRCRPNLIS